MEAKKIGFIGGGAIAEAIISGILSQNLVAAEDVFVAEIMENRRRYLQDTYQIHVFDDLTAVAQQAEILFLTVKPQVVKEILVRLEGKIASNMIVVSVVAGLTIAALETHFPQQAVVRVMPNTPVAVGEGMSAIALGNFAGDSEQSIVESIFRAVGQVVVLKESFMDAVTGLSGSGPGYGFVIIDALADAGVRAGLPRQTAILLAAQTLLGSAKMVLETQKHPCALRDLVTSPGGTTIAGIYELEKAGVRAALIAAVEAAAEKSKSMGKENGR